MKLFKLFKKKDDYNIPKSWDELTLLQFDTITEIKNSEPNRIKRDIKIVSYFSGKSVKEIENLPLTELNKITKPLDFTNTIPSDKWVNEFEIDGHSFFINPDIRTITGSKFIELSTILSVEEINPKVRAEFVAAFMNSKTGKKFEGDDLVNLVYNKGTVGVVYPLFVFFFSSYNRLVKSYSGLFGTTTSETDEGDSPDNGRDTERKITFEEKFAKRWGWYKAIDDICQGRVEIYDKVLHEWNVIRFLNHLSFMKDLNTLRKPPSVS